jgi:hypothetical protein
VAAVDHASAPHSVYPFPRRRRDRGLFSHAVANVMTHLSAAPQFGCKPFVQLSSWSGPHVHHPAESWQQTVNLPAHNDAQLCLLVKAVDSPGEFCRPDEHSYHEAAGLLTGDASVVAHGSAGSCCEEAPAGHPNPDHHHDPVHHTAQAAAKRLIDSPDPRLDQALAAQHGLEVRYFGLVSQSRVDAQSDGCYLIKTVQQRDTAACQCMHYSLIRVAQGSTLAEQAMRFWA